MSSVPTDAADLDTPSCCGCARPDAAAATPRVLLALLESAALLDRIGWSTPAEAEQFRARREAA